MGFAQLPSIATVWSLRLEFFYLIVISAVMSVLFWNAGIKQVGALNGILFINLVPITAFIVALLQGHVFSPAEAAGALITITALVLNNLSARRVALPAAVSPSQS
jgi:drug/metabolite transporter (DMT)-like permease